MKSSTRSSALPEISSGGPFQIDLKRLSDQWAERDWEATPVSRFETFVSGDATSGSGVMLSSEAAGREAAAKTALWVIIQSLPVEGVLDAMEQLQPVVRRYRGELTPGRVERAFQLPGVLQDEVEVEIHPEPMDEETARMVLDW